MKLSKCPGWIALALAALLLMLSLAGCGTTADSGGSGNSAPNMENASSTGMPEEEPDSAAPEETPTEDSIMEIRLLNGDVIVGPLSSVETNFTDPFQNLNFNSVLLTTLTQTRTETEIAFETDDPYTYSIVCSLEDGRPHNQTFTIHTADGLRLINMFSVESLTIKPGTVSVIPATEYQRPEEESGQQVSFQPRGTAVVYLRNGTTYVTCPECFPKVTTSDSSLYMSDNLNYAQTRDFYLEEAKTVSFAFVQESDGTYTYRMRGELTNGEKIAKFKTTDRKWNFIFPTTEGEVIEAYVSDINRIDVDMSAAPVFPAERTVKITMTDDTVFTVPRCAMYYRYLKTSNYGVPEGWARRDFFPLKDRGGLSFFDIRRIDFDYENAHNGTKGDDSDSFYPADLVYTSGKTETVNFDFGRHYDKYIEFFSPYFHSYNLHVSPFPFVSMEMADAPPEEETAPAPPTADNAQPAQTEESVMEVRLLNGDVLVGPLSSVETNFTDSFSSINFGWGLLTTLTQTRTETEIVFETDDPYVPSVVFSLGKRTLHDQTFTINTADGVRLISLFNVESLTVRPGTMSVTPPAEYQRSDKVSPGQQVSFRPQGTATVYLKDGRTYVTSPECFPMISVDDNYFYESEYPDYAQTRDFYLEEAKTVSFAEEGSYSQYSYHLTGELANGEKIAKYLTRNPDIVTRWRLPFLTTEGTVVDINMRDFDHIDVDMSATPEFPTARTAKITMADGTVFTVPQYALYYSWLLFNGAPEGWTYDSYFPVMDRGDLPFDSIRRIDFHYADAYNGTFGDYSDSYYPGDVVYTNGKTETVNFSFGGYYDNYIRVFSPYLHAYSLHDPMFPLASIEFE